MGKHADALALTGRVLMCILFLFSVFGKITDPAGTKQYIAAAGLPLPDIAYIVSVIVELGGGILLLIGYQTRLVAALLALFTIAAALGFHTHFADPNQQVNFLKNLAIAGGFLQIAAFGAGAWSLDARQLRA
jgi:putative oxidoreductase